MLGFIHLLQHWRLSKEEWGQVRLYEERRERFLRIKEDYIRHRRRWDLHHEGTAVREPATAPSVSCSIESGWHEDPGRPGRLHAPFGYREDLPALAEEERVIGAALECFAEWLRENRGLIDADRERERLVSGLPPSPHGNVVAYTVAVNLPPFA